MPEAVLDRRITLRKQVTAGREDGTPIHRRQDLATVWACQERRDIADRRSSGGTWSTVVDDTRTYRIRYRADFEAGERYVAEGGIDYEVISTREIGRRKWLDVTVLWSSN